MKRSSIINGDKNLSPEPGPYNPSMHQNQIKYENYEDYIQQQYKPNKDTKKYIGLDTKDISGASPKDLSKIGGVKRLNFFPHEQATNQYYNKEAHGGVVNPKGYFPTNESHLNAIERKPKDLNAKRYIKRHYPPKNPLMKDVPGFD